MCAIAHEPATRGQRHPRVEDVALQQPDAAPHAVQVDLVGAAGVHLGRVCVCVWAGWEDGRGDVR